MLEVKDGYYAEILRGKAILPQEDTCPLFNIITCVIDEIETILTQEARLSDASMGAAIVPNSLWSVRLSVGAYAQD